MNWFSGIISNQNELCTYMCIYMLAMARTIMPHKKNRNQKKRKVWSMLPYVIVHHVHILFYFYTIIYLWFWQFKSINNGLQRRFSVTLTHIILVIHGRSMSICHTYHIHRIIFDSYPLIDKSYSILIVFYPILSLSYYITSVDESQSWDTICTFYEDSFTINWFLEDFIYLKKVCQRPAVNVDPLIVLI